MIAAYSKKLLTQLFRRIAHTAVREAVIAPVRNDPGWQILAQQNIQNLTSIKFSGIPDFVEFRDLTLAAEFLTWSLLDDKNIVVITECTLEKSGRTSLAVSFEASISPHDVLDPSATAVSSLIEDLGLRSPSDILEKAGVVVQINPDSILRDIACQLKHPSAAPV